MATTGISTINVAPLPSQATNRDATAVKLDDVFTKSPILSQVLQSFLPVQKVQKSSHDSRCDPLPESRTSILSKSLLRFIERILIGPQVE